MKILFYILTFFCLLTLGAIGQSVTIDTTKAHQIIINIDSAADAQIKVVDPIYKKNIYESLYGYFYSINIAYKNKEKDAIYEAYSKASAEEKAAIDSKREDKPPIKK